jgi:peptidyl-prolyl cis-trans isomerase A (cyclophilin A)
MKNLGLLLVLSLFGLAAAAPAPGNPRVRLKTTAGEVVIELYPDKAPVTVQNFLGYVNSGFYRGTIFHRVIPGFMIQGGGLTASLEPKPTQAPIKNEATNGLKNDRGTVAMARTAAPESATAQFFINVADNNFLNHRDASAQGFGYAVFGRVIQGMDVVDKIVASPTTTVGPHQNVPVKPVVIEAAEVLTAKTH